MVGDRVRLEKLPDGSHCITEVLPRESLLARRSLARRSQQVIAANVDQVAAVASAAQPEPDLRMLDGLLAVAELNGLAAFVVLNKVDLVPEAEELPGMEAYRRAGYTILPTSASERTGLGALWGRLRSKVSVFSGPSGVGKSSLLNALMPGLRLRVGDVRERSGKGRHTTVGGLLIPLQGGGYLADTPGIQHFEPGAVDPRELSSAFREFGPHLTSCRFADCRHREEPGCEVRHAVDAGSIDARRFESYHEMLERAEDVARTDRGGA